MAIDRTAEYGILTDYTTGVELRAATAEEHTRSREAGETGAYRDDDGRAVFVAGGPERVDRIGHFEDSARD